MDRYTRIESTWNQIGQFQFYIERYQALNLFWDKFSYVLIILKLFTFLNAVLYRVKLPDFIWTRPSVRSDWSRLGSYLLLQVLLNTCVKGFREPRTQRWCFYFYLLFPLRIHSKFFGSAFVVLILYAFWYIQFFKATT